jgi:hypothetical protein
MQDHLQPSSLAKSKIYQRYNIGKTTKATKHFNKIKHQSKHIKIN